MKTEYNKIIGYSPLENVDHNKMRQMVVVIKAIINEHYTWKRSDKILVAGAGSGYEALLLGEEFRLKTVGVDINISEKTLSAINDDSIEFQRQDLENLAFNKDAFSIIYCMHVLEHVKNHKKVLQELGRVLKPQGILFIGFPNKHRLVGYIGTSQHASFAEKIKWNLNDYKDRLMGRFENRFGAHAGFSDREFVEDASCVFNRIYRVRRQYMSKKYLRYKTTIDILSALKLDEFIFPSNYYVCFKE